jgi:serine protease Do
MITRRRIAGACLAAGLMLSPEASAQPPSLRVLNNGVRILADRIRPAIVQISAVGIGGMERYPGRLQSNQSTGSGVLVDPAGYIVTNAHVVASARRVQVMLAPSIEKPGGGRSILRPAGRTVDAEVVGIDLETDVAVLKVPGAGLPSLRFADSEAIQQGDFVFAAGSPFGLDNSISMGIVSSVARQIRPDDPVIYIQTDASINPGNSGGPLVDSDGDIIGINTFILSQSGGNEGIGFAVPGNIVNYVFTQIREFGRVRRGQIGVIAQTISPKLAAALNLKQDWGVLLADVTSGSAAESAGLEVKDIVLSLNGKSLENARQFGVNIYQHAGETIVLELLRGDKKVEKRVAVLERQRDPNRIQSLLNGEANTIGKLGILAVELDEKVTPMLPPLRRLAGVVVAGLAAGTADRRENFQPGDVIYECNGRPVRNIGELKAILQNMDAAQPVALHIERQGQLQYFLLDLE